MDSYAATHISWESIEDDYEQGELGRSNLVLDESIFVQARSPAAIIGTLSSRYGLPGDRAAWAAFDGRLTCQFTVDDDNMEATQRDIEAWKKKRKRLWSAHIDVAVVRVSMPTTDEIAEAFGVANMEDS